MTNLNRRNFLGFTSAFIGSAVAAPAFATPSTTEKWDMTTDIVIVGAGGAGLAAAAGDDTHQEPHPLHPDSGLWLCPAGFRPGPLCGGGALGPQRGVGRLPDGSEGREVNRLLESGCRRQPLFCPAGREKACGRRGIRPGPT